MGGFDPADGFGLGLDGPEEVRPEESEVVAVGFLQLVILVDGLFLGVGGMKGPTIPPAHVEDALGAVEIGPDGVFFGVVPGVFPVFPSGGE